MAIDKKNFVDKQISSPKNVPESNFINSGQDSSFINIGQDNSLINPGQDSSFANPDARVVIPILNHKNFGQNTKIAGELGEVVDSGNCNTTKELGRISVNNPVELLSDADYDNTVNIGPADMLERNKVHQTLRAFGVKELGESPVNNIAKIKIKTPALGLNGKYTILRTPMFIPWKIFKETVGDEEKRYLGIGPITIPYLRDDNSVVDMSLRRSGAISIDNGTQIQGSVLDIGYTQFDYTMPSSTPELPIIIDEGSNAINGLSVLNFKDSKGGSLYLSANYGNLKKESWTESSYVSATVTGIETVELVPPGKFLQSLNIRYMPLTGSSAKGQFDNVDHYDGRSDTLHGLDRINVRGYKDEPWTYGAVKSFTFTSGNIPDGVSFQLIMEGRTYSFYSGGSSEASADNTGMDIKALGVRELDESDNIIDPLIQFNRGGSYSYGASYAKLDVFDMDTTEDIVISIDINNLSRSSISNDDDTASVYSGIGLGTITGISNTTATTKKYIFEDLTNVQDKDLIYASNAYFKKIYKLSNRYTLTYVESRVSLDATPDDRYRYFGVYDNVDNIHLTPSNAFNNTSYGLPIQTALQIDDINIITDDRHILGVIIKYNDANGIKRMGYLSIKKALDFNGTTLLKSEAYRENTMCEFLMIEDGKVVSHDKDFNIASNLPGNNTVFSYRAKELSYSMFCGSKDIAYEKRNKQSNIAIHSGFYVLTHSERFVEQNISLINDIALFAGNTISFPLLVPQGISLPIHDDSVDNSSEYDGNLDTSRSAAELIYWLKQIVGYNWKRVSGDVGTFKRTGSHLIPSTGTLILCKTPSIDKEKNYNVLPLKAVEMIGVDPTLTSIRVGSNFVSIGGLSLTESAGGLYISSSYKLIPSGTKDIIDINGTINIKGNLICVSTDLASYLYMLDRSGNANYILSIPDVVLSNIVSIGGALVLAGKLGIYLFSENNYRMIYDIPEVVEYSVIKPMGNDAYIVCYKADSGEFLFYSINMFHHVTQLDYVSSMSNYRIVRGTKGITDKLVLLNTLWDQPTKIASVTTRGFAPGTRTATFKSRPLSLTNQQGLEFLMDRISFYYKGYGLISFTIGDMGYGIDAEYICKGDVPYLCVTDIPYTVKQTKAPIGEGSDLDALQKTSRNISPTYIDYVELEVTFDNTLAIDKIEIEGIYTRR